ncbi:MAG: AAA family ATPase [Candidatus Bathyarchaeia archaeon]
MKRIVVMGRGGIGKTSFVALMTKFFIEIDDTPLLLVDVDPDQNLGEMVGVNLKEEGKETISELLIKTFIEGGGTTVGIPPSEKMESEIWARGLYEGEFFDLIAVGTKFVEGCYCLPDAALKGALQDLTKTYRYVLIDSPAGLEHLNRRIASKVEDIFDMVGPSKKSFDHVKRAYRIIKEVNIQFENFYLLGGYRFPKNLEKRAEETELKYLGRINYDENVEKFILEGRSLLELPSDSPAYVSVKEIMQRAGYTSLKELLFPKR